MKKKPQLKNIVLLIIIGAVLFSCKKEDEVKEEDIVIEIPKTHKEFGFILNDFLVVHDTVKNGDTFGKLLESHDLAGLRVYDIVEKIKDSFNLRAIKVGRPVTFLKSPEEPHSVRAFIYQTDAINYCVVDLRDSIRAYNRKKPLTIKRRMIATEIEGSLFETLSKAGVDVSLAHNLATVYAYSVDFFRIQKGDRFAITFNERFINDTIYAGVENLEASFFEYKGNTFYAFPYKIDSTSKKVDYYDEEGKELKAMFLKAPLDFFRISSRYSPRRFHPVQKTWKAHQGTDYAAPHGTPIKATAAGTVERTGYTAGNGNFVKIKHNSTYSTQYLHMSKILVKQGQRISQGEIIGKVGSTGLATGPHVCYRFWKNGKQVDPLVEVMPKSEPMPEKAKPGYLAHITPLKKELDSIAAHHFK